MDNRENYNLLIAKKTEKIVTAIYLVTQFLSREEKIKFEIRGEANQLLKNISNIAYLNDKNSFVFYGSDDQEKNIFLSYKNALDNVSLLISYLFVAKNSSLISIMNTEIVIDALRSLENILAKKQFSFSKENILITEENEYNNLLSKNNNSVEENLFNKNTSFDSLSTRYLTARVEDNKKKEESSFEKRMEKEKIEIIEDLEEDEKNEKNEEVIKSPIKDIIKKPVVINDKPKVSPKPASLPSVSYKKSVKSKDRKNNRRDQIMSFFTPGVEVSIKDISKKVIGCSIKTIQRELNELVDTDKILKIGDKRWSKYLLK